MKKLSIVSAVFAFIAIGFLTIADHYKFEIYKAAIGFESGLSGLSEKFVEINIGTISYYENQQPISKPSVLLVHGFGAYKENWLRFARAFKDEFHVVVIDLPGHGKSVQSMDLTYNLTNQVEWLNEFTQKIGLDTFHMAGNSMGGAITVSFASLYPDKVLTATLINPAGVIDYRAVMQDYLDRGENPLVVKQLSDFSGLMDFALEKKPFMPWPITEVSALRAIALKDVHEKLWLDIKTGLYRDFKSKLISIKAPTLVQWGKMDRVINFKNIFVFEKLIFNVSAHVWEGVGHAPMIEIPQQSAELMIDHISKNIK
jgi:pimeloyl-ACP methyl ester carboxylesterase